MNVQANQRAARSSNNKKYQGGVRIHRTQDRMANQRLFVAPLLALLIAAPGLAQVPQPVAQGWSGWAHCDITIQASGYSHREIHLWTMTGAGTRNANVEIYPATWTVTGNGSLQRLNGPTMVSAQWTVNGTLQNVTIGTTLHADRITVQRWTNHGPARSGLTGTEISTTNGVARSRSVILDVQQWAFPGIEAGTTSTRATGSTTLPFDGLRGPMNPPGDAVGTAACAWDFARGGVSPSTPPPSAVPSPPTSTPGTPVSSGAPAGSGSGGANAGGATAGGAATGGSSAGAGGAPPPAGGAPATGAADGIAITEVTPASALPGARAVAVSIRATGTHFVQGVSYVDFGELAGATSLTITSPTTATAIVNVDPAAPSGPRTVTMTTPSPDGTTEAVSRVAGFTVGGPEGQPTSGRYRVTAPRAKFHREEPDYRPRLHGRNNEIWVTSHEQVIDRRNGTRLGGYIRSMGSIPADVPYVSWAASTPIHGDINVSHEPLTGDISVRVQAGSFAPSGGIQTGDEINIWDSARRSGSYVVRPSEYLPFLMWEGELHDGVEVLLIRPAVWLYAAGDGTEWSMPHNRRIEAEQSVDFLALPAIRDALAQPGIRVPAVPQLVTSARWTADNRPFGLDVSSNQNGAPATYTDRVVVLTREKIEAWLRDAGTDARTIEVTFRGRMNGPNPIPLGEVSLFLRIERVP